MKLLNTPEQKRLLDINTLPKVCYCCNCDDFVNYDLIQREEIKSVRKIKFAYTAYSMKCKECGNLLYPEYLEDLNEEARSAAYREAANIITVEDIQNTLKKYSITVRPMSLILGWGEITLTRFIDGAMPTPEYSNEFRRVAEDPEYYRYLLCKNSDKIPQSVLEKSLRKVNQIIGDISDDPVICAVACYIKDSVEVTSLALQKLLYYIQGFFAAIYETNCFKESCFAWANGPVYPMVYYLNRLRELDSKKNPRSLISDELMFITNNVLKYMGSCSGDKLRQMTHRETPWLNASLKSPEDYPGRLIPFEDIRDYFCSVVNEDSVQEDIGTEIRNYLESVPAYLEIL